MKQITSRMTFSSFGGLSGPARCATAIVREDDHAGPGGAPEKNVNTDLLDAAIDAGKKLALAIDRTLKGKIDLTELDSPEKFDFSAAPLEGALVRLFRQGLSTVEEIRWLCHRRRHFSVSLACRLLFEITCNVGWISHSNCKTRAASFWEWVGAVKRIRPAHMNAPEKAADKIKAAKKENREKYGNGDSFPCVTLKDKTKELGGQKFYGDIYGVLSDISHGDHFWVMPTDEMTDMDVKHLSVVMCREFVRMAKRTAKCCGIPDSEWSALFGMVNRQLEEEAHNYLKNSPA